MAEHWRISKQNCKIYLHLTYNEAVDISLKEIEWKLLMSHSGKNWISVKNTSNPWRSGVGWRRMSILLQSKAFSCFWGAFDFNWLLRSLFTTIELQKRRRTWTILSFFWKWASVHRLSLGWCGSVRWVKKMRWRPWWRWPCRWDQHLWPGGYLWRGQCEVTAGEGPQAPSDLRDQMWIQSKCGIRKDSFTYSDFSRTIFWALSMAFSSVCRSSV